MAIFTKEYFDQYGNNRPQKLLDFIRYLEQCLGKAAIKEYYPMQPSDVYQTYADVTDLMRDFDFKPHTPLVVGLRHFCGLVSRILPSRGVENMKIAIAGADYVGLSNAILFISAA